MIPSSVVASVGAAAALSAAWPVVLYAVGRKRMTLAARNIWIGAGMFFLSALVLERLLHFYVLKANPDTAEFLKTHPMWMALYGCCAAALFEEAGRYLGMRFLVRPTGNPGTAVAYGIGHGGMESIMVGSLGLLNAFVFALMVNAGTFDSTFKPVLAPDVLAQLHGSLARLSVLTSMIATLERLAALLIQIGLSLLVWRAVERRQLRWLALALLAHAGIDFFPGLVQTGQLSSAVVEGGLMVLAIGLVALFLHGLPHKMAAQPAGPA